MKLKQLAVAILFFLSLHDVLAHDANGWKPVNIPRGLQRAVNGIQVLDANTIVAVGGNETNDSVRSVFRSSDKGQSWDLVMDSVDRSWLTSVHFVNTQIGFAVGADGAVLKTTNGGLAWTVQSVPQSVKSRDFNSVVFLNAQTGFIAGGRRSNDSIQTILKTTNGGDTWSVQRDQQGYWLRSLFFTDANTGYAVGENGVALKTINGGSNWTQLALPVNTAQRDFNTVFFLDAQTGFLGGGNEANDSIRTILKTTDGGANWDIISDNVASWIQSIHFTPSGTGFAVGDDGSLLLSEDTGATWNPVAIPDSVNDAFRAFKAVHFLNSDFGSAGGEFGKMLVYESVTPVNAAVVTGYATEITPTAAQLNGTVNANNSTASVSFEYGTSQVLGLSAAAVPGTVSGNSVTAVSAAISGLTPNTLYYYRVKAVRNNETSYGLVRQFYAAENPIPNWDFESWKHFSAYLPDDWITIGTATQVTSYDGSFAVEMVRNDSVRTSAVLHGLPSEPEIAGGVPFAARPDSLIGYFKYDIPANDSAIVLILFKKNRVVNSQQFYYLNGSSNGNFERMSFPITFMSSDVPDSVILGIANVNPWNENPHPVGMVAVDNISFTGTALNVPNPGFEDWSTRNREEPVGWTGTGIEFPIDAIPASVIKTTDKQHGNYAIKVQNVLKTGVTGRIETGERTNNGAGGPDFPVYARHRELHLHLKYLPQGNDSALIRLSLFKNGLHAGDAALKLGDTISSYTLFTLPINYPDPNIIPDSAAIQVEAGLNIENAPPLGESELFLDNLSFDGFYKAEFSAYAGGQISVCSGDSAVLGGNPAAAGGTLPYTYAWSPAGEVSDPAAANPLVSPASDATYQLTVTDANGATSTDAVSVTVEDCTGVDETLDEPAQWVIYPNPAQNEIFIQCNGNTPDHLTVTLLDLNGKKISERKEVCKTARCSFEIPIESLESGCYLLTLQGNHSVATAKVLVLR